jgi:Family of unknown function (DUF6603)
MSKAYRSDEKGLMSAPDKVFKKSYSWFRESVDRALAITDPSITAAVRAEIAERIFALLGLQPMGGTLPANPNVDDFASPGAAAESIAFAAVIAGESLAAIDTVRAIVEASDNAKKLEALKVIGDIIKQVDRIAGAGQNVQYPSAFGLAKILLTVSGDAQVTPKATDPQAKNLARLIASTLNVNDLTSASAALGLSTLLAGCIVDRSFNLPSNLSEVGWLVSSTLPKTAPSARAPGESLPKVTIPFKVPGVPPASQPTLELSFVTTPPNEGVRAKLTGGLNRKSALDGGPDLALEIDVAGTLDAFVPKNIKERAQVTDANLELGIAVSRKRADGKALVIGPFEGATIQIGELGMGVRLKKGGPRLDVFARKGKATLDISESFLREALAAKVSVDFDIEAEADAKGKIRLKDGTGLRVTLPVPNVPSGPFKLQLITFGIETEADSFDVLRCELSASFGVSLGPFQGSVDRLGVLVRLEHMLAGNPNVDFAFKPPSGAGLALDTGVVMGGGYLYFDPDRGEYAGALELKLMQIGVKAIGILTTKNPIGWSLLLMMYGQFPAIQLSWGFTLTGVGGLIGVQHMVNTEALSKGISSGSLDAILFPENPVADAPQIINKLRTLFPTAKGGFVIGPMLEIGWGTPSLLTVQLGVLLDMSIGSSVSLNKLVLLGRLIVQLPPMAGADLALLYLQVDFVGSVVFDPLKIAFDGRLVNSRVLVITLTGSFCFRAAFGDHPSFLLSAGGFHPRFHDLPSDVPRMDRLGVGFDIGIVGIRVEIYFAITSATVQSGAEVAIWGDVGVASFEAGFGYDAICYLEPKFYFDIDMRAYADIEVFGAGLFSARIRGALAGPGRWRAAGDATIEIWLLPDVDVHFDERWGTDRSTPPVTERAVDLLKAEIDKVQNWAAQLPSDGESYVTLAKMSGVASVLAHPRSPLTFQQKRVPLGKRIKRIGIARIEGPDRFSGGVLTINAAPVSETVATVEDYFAAAQFFDVSDSDRLEGPSFERYDAGLTMEVDNFECGPLIEETLDYEEVNLSGGANRFQQVFYLDLAASGSWSFKLGAAGRSALRERAKLDSPVKAKIDVDPPPYAVSGRKKLAAVSAAAQDIGFWAARDVIAETVGLSRGTHQIVETFELLI